MGMLLVMFAANMSWAYLGNKMAASRGRRTRLWVWLAVLFGPFAIIPLKFMPPRPSHA